MNKTKLPIVAGFLEIILACVSMFIGSMALTLTRIHILMTLYTQFILGIFGIVAFIFGLVGGILAIKRHRFAWASFGVLLITGWAFWFDWYILSAHLPSQIFEQGIMFGNLMILLSIVDLVLLFASKAEFT